MLVTQYNNNSAIAVDPERANNAMFKLNNAVYRLVRLTRDEAAADRGEHRIGSITINKFKESDGQFGSSTTTSTERYINALSSMTFPFDPYALYNAYPIAGDMSGPCAPGLLRRRRHSYSRSISPATVMHFGINNLRRGVYDAGPGVPVTLGTVDGDGEGIGAGAFAYALLGRYPTLDTIVGVTIPGMLQYNAPIRHIALGPSLLLSLINPREGGSGGNLYMRDFSLPSPMAYIGTRINLNITDRCVIIHCNDENMRTRFINALEAFSPSGGSGWTYRGP
jgi:hypothetical protein